jgi:hypothetical protein
MECWNGEVDSGTLEYWNDGRLDWRIVRTPIEVSNNSEFGKMLFHFTYIMIMVSALHPIVKNRLTNDI